ncbi:MAG: YoaK family protein [Solirubrobacteraceae bacterium]
MSNTISAAVRSEAWLLGLALAGGAVDAMSYLGLGKVFPANMTGNTVLLAVDLARGTGVEAARAAVALGGFCLGTALAVVAVPPHRLWPARARGPLLLEACALTALLVAWVVLGLTVRYPLIAVAGVAMGAQSVVVRASNVHGVNTTFITSTLVNAIARLVQRLRRTPASADDPSLPSITWVTYGLGAVGGAFAVRAWQADSVAIPLAIVAAITIAAWLPRRAAGRLMTSDPAYSGSPTDKE